MSEKREPTPSSGCVRKLLLHHEFCMFEHGCNVIQIACSRTSQKYLKGLAFHHFYTPCVLRVTVSRQRQEYVLNLSSVSAFAIALASHSQDSQSQTGKKTEKKEEQKQTEVRRRRSCIEENKM